MRLPQKKVIHSGFPRRKFRLLGGSQTLLGMTCVVLAGIDMVLARHRMNLCYQSRESHYERMVERQVLWWHVPQKIMDTHPTVLFHSYHTLGLWGSLHRKLQLPKPTITLSGYCIHWAGAHCQLTSEAIWNLWLEAPGPLSERCSVPRGTFV